MSRTQTSTTTRNAAEQGTLRYGGGKGESRGLQLGDTLKGYKQSPIEPTLGIRFEKEFQLKEILEKPEAERTALLRDLAITISRNGVIVLKDQSSLPADKLADLVHLLGVAIGKPKDSGLHIHPYQLNRLNDDGSPKERGETISNQFEKRGVMRYTKSSLASHGWHVDISFEPVPAQYTTLRINTVPKSGGGDTMFSSSYEAYDRLSPAYKRFLSGLTATHGAPFFREDSIKGGYELYTRERGNPKNRGDALEAVHPVVRTNPVTGWNALYVNRVFTQRINELDYDESESVLKYLFDLQTQSHDFQLRVKWEAGDLAIWDNSTVLHSATFNYANTERRSGDRAVGLGEAPYLDPAGISRREGLAKEVAAAA